MYAESDHPDSRPGGGIDRNSGDLQPPRMALEHAGNIVAPIADGAHKLVRGSVFRVLTCGALRLQDFQKGGGISGDALTIFWRRDNSHCEGSQVVAFK